MIINLDFVYPIGSLYLSASTISPETLFGGKWEQITDDAYLKIVDTDLELGQLGGTSSDHKIPVKSMPSHRHNVAGNWAKDASNTGNWGAVIQSINNSYNFTPTHLYSQLQAAGGGEAYYPYYYGIYVWKRIG